MEQLELMIKDDPVTIAEYAPKKTYWTILHGNGRSILPIPAKEIVI
jgi:hypothetical protein